MLLHSGEKPWKCRHCDRAFPQQSARSKSSMQISCSVNANSMQPYTSEPTPKRSHSSVTSVKRNSPSRRTWPNIARSTARQGCTSARSKDVGSLSIGLINSRDIIRHTARRTVLGERLLKCRRRIVRRWQGRNQRLREGHLNRSRDQLVCSCVLVQRGVYRG